jgi:hypothetical protein
MRVLARRTNWRITPTMCVSVRVPTNTSEMVVPCNKRVTRAPRCTLLQCRKLASAYGRKARPASVRRTFPRMRSDIGMLQQA